MRPHLRDANNFWRLDNTAKSFGRNAHAAFQIAACMMEKTVYFRILEAAKNQSLSIMLRPATNVEQIVILKQ
jgi:hypothetical protein